MIVRPEKMDFSGKHFSMILYGSPGVGKTTLALSAPDPVLIDFDRGMGRVAARHRKPAIFCNTYEEVLADLNDPAMNEFQTIVVDTGGSFVTYLQDWAMRSNPAQNQQKNGAISLKGFGVVKAEFTRFTNYVKDTLNKNLIFVFHSQEQTDKDGNSQQRLMCEGAARNLVWTPCDFGGYVQVIDGRRYICFSPEQEFFAKGCHGISGKVEVPVLADDVQNDLVTRIFEKAKKNIAAETEAFAPEKNAYDLAMSQGRALIDRVTDADSANAALDSLKAMKHALTSKKETAALLRDKTKSLKLVFKDGKYEYILPKMPEMPEPEAE